MKSDCSNIYKKARLNAGLTQETASDLLHVAVRTLAAYESGNVTPPADLVIGMCEQYHADWLAYMYLQSANPVGRKYLPPIDFSNLSTSILRFQKEMSDASRVSSIMIEVACDGRVDGSELEVWEKVTQEIMHLVGAGLALAFAQKEKTASRAVS